MKNEQSKEPQEISKHVWYYEQGRKLTFIVQSQDMQQFASGVIMFHVPLRMLEKSLSRSPKKGQRR